VVAAVNGELTVKKLFSRKGRVSLVAAHPDYPPILIKEETGLEIWGVVTNVIHKV
jgi:DNA polymerase V